MAKARSSQLSVLDLIAAPSLFRSLFMEGWEKNYATWQATITKGSLEWVFTSAKLHKIVSELDILLNYPESVIRAWLPKICSGLPTGSPNPELTSTEFVTQVKDLVSHMAADWEQHGKPRCTKPVS